MARWFVDRSAQRGIPSVSLRRLLPDARFVGCRDLEVSGCSADSRRLDPGQVFVAVKGRRHDGHAFIGTALERGAAAVVVERPCPDAGPLQVVVPDSRQALARLRQALAGDPSEALPVVGVAGTRGKTAAAHFVRAIFEADGSRTGLVEPFSWSDGVDAHPSGPDAGGLAERLSAMLERGCAKAVVEVAEATLAERGIAGMTFEAAIVTTLAAPAGEADADRHRRRAHTARLFKSLAPGGVAIVNAEDPEADLMGSVNLDARVISFALGGPADVIGEVVRMDASGTRLRLRGLGREVTVTLGPVGKAAARQATAAAALAWAHGLSAEAAAAGLESVAAIPGRLEPASEWVFIDRARTAGELIEALATLQKLAPGRVHCVLGAEGLRDIEGRGDLARTAECWADRLVLTSDNPRTEDPDAILDALLAGLRHPGRARVEPDRRAAIASTLAQVEPGDLVLIAGKGRQAFQILADRAVPFDDRLVVAECLGRPAARRSA